MKTTAARQPQEAAAKTAKIKATAPKPALAVRRGTDRDAEADKSSATNAAPSAASPRPLSVDGRAGEANSAPNRANERAGKRKAFAHPKSKKPAAGRVSVLCREVPGNGPALFSSPVRRACAPGRVSVF